MRLLLAVMFFTPLVAMYAVSAGMQSVTPLLLVMGTVAIVAQLLIEARQRRKA